MLEQMLHLDGDVVCQPGAAASHGLDPPVRMADAVQNIRVTERDVRHEIGLCELGLERLARQVDAPDVETGACEPRGRRGETERLTPELAGQNQDDAHVACSLFSASVGGGVIRLTTTSVAIDSASAGKIVCHPKR